MEDNDIRNVALHHAIEAHRQRANPGNADAIIATAKKFENFLNNKEE